jgi:hypothetical protein
MEWLFSWEVASWFIAGFIAAAFAFLAMDDFRLAKLFFLLAAADAAGGIVMWGTKANLPGWQRTVIIFLLCGAVGVLCVQAFRYVDMKRGSKEGAKGQPDLKFEFSNTFWGERDGRLMFIVAGTVLNPHGPDTGLANWQISLELPVPSHSTIRAIILPRTTDITRPLGANVSFIPSEYLPEKTIEPVRSGAGISGWIWCEFALSEDDFRKWGSTVLTVSFDDIVSGKSHQSKQIISDTRKGVDLIWKPKPSAAP